MDSHLEGSERKFGNRRNGYMSKQVQTSGCTQTQEDPCGQNYRPVVIGNSTREISDILEEQFCKSISAETISSTTDRVLPEIQSWKTVLWTRCIPSYGLTRFITR